MLKDVEIRAVCRRADGACRRRPWPRRPADTLVIAKQIDDLISMDPAEAYELSGIEILANTYDRIMRFEPTDITKLVGGVAESVTVSDDGKTFTFKIRPGQKFASGNPVTATDAAFSLQRVIKLEKTPVFLISQLGWTKDNVDKLVTAPDESTLQVTITEDFAPSLVYALLSSIVGSVVDMKVAMEHQADGDFGYAWLKTNSAGSGAYTIKSWKPNEAVVLEANPNYRGGAAKLKRVVIRHVPEAAAQRLALEKGDVDIARNLTPDQVAGLAGNARCGRHFDTRGAALLHRPQPEAEGTSGCEGAPGIALSRRLRRHGEFVPEGLAAGPSELLGLGLLGLAR